MEETQKSSEDELRELQHYTRGLIEASQDIMVTFNIEGIITDVNQQTVEVTGATRDEERRSGDDNLKTVYKIGTVPCDTQMRTILDGVDPDCMGPTFRHIFGQL
ncbi:MAG: PAS domain-containing protein [Euryarchaeota archaeon]|nr:PAS domain-containing protein [Euryarchaeota archaeon]